MKNTVISAVSTSVLTSVLTSVFTSVVLVSVAAASAVPPNSTTNPATTPSTPSGEVAPPSKAPPQVQGMPSVPATPAMVTEVLEAIPFELANSYVHNMRKDVVTVTRGHVLVIRAPKAFLIPRQLADSVLLVGAQTAERCNVGYESGVLVVVVPQTSEVGSDGVTRVADPLRSRIYFASPELPERVDAAWIAAEAAKADAAKLPATCAVNARALNGARTFDDRDALGLLIADLIARYAPDELERAEALRAVD